jgi:hypothetical protein
VILIRERSEGNRPIFDIQGLHAYEYNVRAYSSLNDYLVGKIAAFESGEEIFSSPVFDVLETEAQFEKFGRARATRLIQLLQVGLTSQLRSFTVAVNQYLIGRTEISLTTNVSALAQDLWEKREQLALVDWSEVKLVQGPHPSLAYYLSTHYLGGIVDDRIEIPVSVAFLRYYEAYFINVAWWFGFDLNLIISFVQHTTLLSLCCGALTRILQSEEGDSSDLEARQHLRQILDSMHWA